MARVVRVPGSDVTLRVITSPRRMFGPDRPVSLTISPDLCRVIPPGS